jgi:hypothetical protein
LCHMGHGCPVSLVRLFLLPLTLRPIGHWQASRPSFLPAIAQRNGEISLLQRHADEVAAKVTKLGLTFTHSPGGSRVATASGRPLFIDLVESHGDQGANPDHADDRDNRPRRPVGPIP